MYKISSVLPVSILLLSTVVSAQGYQDVNWQDIKEQQIIAHQKQAIQLEKNLTQQWNNRIQSIEESKRTNFTIKSPKQLDLWVRGSFTIIENDYVVKNAPTWKKILIKQKNIWDY